MEMLLTLKTPQEMDAADLATGTGEPRMPDKDRPATETFRTFSRCDYIHVNVSMHLPVKS